MAWQKFALNRPGNTPLEFIGKEFCVTVLPQIERAFNERVAFYIRQDGEVALECATQNNQMLHESVTVHETLETAVDFLATLPLGKDLYEQAFEDLASRGLWGARGTND